MSTPEFIRRDKQLLNYLFKKFFTFSVPQYYASIGRILAIEGIEDLIGIKQVARLKIMEGTWKKFYKHWFQGPSEADFKDTFLRFLENPEENLRDILKHCSPEEALLFRTRIKVITYDQVRRHILEFLDN